MTPSSETCSKILSFFIASLRALPCLQCVVEQQHRSSTKSPRNSPAGASQCPPGPRLAPACAGCDNDVTHRHADRGGAVAGTERKSAFGTPTLSGSSLALLFWWQ